MPGHAQPDGWGDDPTWRLRPATAGDADAVSRLVDAAYRHYIEQVGGPPGPMLADYRQVIAERLVTLAEVDGELAGLLVTAAENDYVIENVAVHPGRQGQGLGRRLLDLAEFDAEDRGYDSVLLYTHETMTENLAIYRRRGYLDERRKPLPDGSHLIYLRRPHSPLTR